MSACRSLVIVFTVGFFLTVPFESPGQDSQLTNDDVITMLNAGIPEETVILAIKRSKSAFDTSPEALINLMKSGASQSVLDAMLLAGTPADATGDTTSVPDGYPPDSGVYLITDSGYQPMELVTSSGARAGSLLKMIGTAGLAGHGQFDVYPGPTSRQILSTSQPEFIVRQAEISDRDLMVLRLKVRKRTREIQKTSDNVFQGTAQFGYQEKDKAAINVTRLGTDVFEVTFVEALPPGEYLLVWPALDGALGVAPRGYDFTVR